MNTSSKIRNVYAGGTLTYWANIFTIISGSLVLIPIVFHSQLKLSSQLINILIDTSNIIICSFFIYVLLYKRSEIEAVEYADLFTNENEADRKQLIGRSDLVMDQFKKFLVMYLITCILFYIVQLTKTSYQFNSKAFLDKISLLSSLDDVGKPLGPQKQSIGISEFFLYIFLDFGENIFNFISALGVVYAFRVLYFRTIDENNKNTINYLMLFLFISVFILLYILILIAPVVNYPISYRFDLFRFVPGLLNGVGMMLLFGRIQAIEYFFKRRLAKTGYNTLFIVSVVVILPVYAIVQPIFALFNFFKEINGELIQAITLTISFFGKVSFLIAMLTLLKDGFLSRYLITVLISQRKLD